MANSNGKRDGGEDVTARTRAANPSRKDRSEKPDACARHRSADQDFFSNSSIAAQSEATSGLSKKGNVAKSGMRVW
jgi:hypothetical protein